MADAPDDDVLRRMLDGDSEAFRVVYRAVQPGLLRYVTSLVGSTEAEDVTAEAWAQAVRDLDRFRGGVDGFRGWMATIARHRALDLLRSLGRQPALESDGDLPDRGWWPAAEDEALTLASTSAALRLIRSLPADQAEAVLLRVVMGLDAPTAAKVLGKRPGAVRTAAHRGLRTLERLVREGGVVDSLDRPIEPGSNTSRTPAAEKVR